MKDHLSSIQTYARLMKSLKPYKIIFMIGIFGTVIGSLVDAGLAYMIKPVINEGFIEHNLDFIRWLPILVVLVFLVRGGAGFLSNYFIYRVGRLVVMDYRQKIFSHLLRLPASYFDHKTSGQLLAVIIYNVEQIAHAVTESLLTFVQETVLAIGLIIVMFLISWQLTLLFLIVTPFISMAVRISSLRMRQTSRLVQDAIADVSHISEETIEGYKVIRTFGGEQSAQEKFNRSTVVNRQLELKVVVTNTLSSALIQILLAIPIAFTLYLATKPSMNISAGAFAAMLIAMLTILSPVKRLTKLNQQIQKGIAAGQSIFKFLEEPLEKDPGKKSVEKVEGKIEFRHVVFAYPSRDRQVLCGINVSIQAGSKVALVGRSGSGKSTFINLLPRFYDLISGQILIDDIDIYNYRLADLRQQYAFVSQDITLFNDTVARNIAYGRLSNVSEKEIIRVAKLAEAMSFIEQLPDGLNTMIGENGVTLSGGQRQRIAIARALLKDAPILLLDEATSALDTESERLIQAALDKLLANKTAIIVAHRLSTIETADRILVLDQGHIVEEGTHLDLLLLNKHYAKLHAIQSTMEAKIEPIYAEN